MYYTFRIEYPSCRFLENVCNDEKQATLRFYDDIRSYLHYMDALTEPYSVSMNKEDDKIVYTIDSCKYTIKCILGGCKNINSLYEGLSAVVCDCHKILVDAF